MNLKYLLLLIFVFLILQFNFVSSSDVNTNFHVQDENGNPIQDALVIAQGILTDFNQNKLTNSNGDVSFSLDEDEIFLYIVHKLSYEEESDTFYPKITHDFNVVLKKLPENQWYFYRKNNGDIEFQFSSLDSDTIYQPGETIQKTFKISNKADGRVKLLDSESLFQIVDSESLKPLKDWGNFNPQGKTDFANIILKKEGWIEATLMRDKVKICGGKVIISFDDTVIELSGDESICSEAGQNYNEIPLWILQNDYRFNIDYAYEIDGQKKSLSFLSQEFSIENATWKPEIISSPKTNLNVSETWRYSLNLKEDGDVFSPAKNNIKYRLLEAPSGMSIDGNEGLLSWTPSEKGNYSISVSAYYEYFEDDLDKVAFDNQNFVLNVQEEETVKPINNVPVITTTPTTGVDENTPYFYDVDATDADGDTLTYVLTKSPSWLSIDSTTGIITGTAQNVSANTNYDISVGVTDGKNTTIQSYILTVKNIVVIFINNLPTITSNPLTEVNEFENYFYDVQAIDVDGDTLTYNFMQSPNWLTISSNTGEIFGKAPLVSNDSSYFIEVGVSDGENTTIQSYTLNVLDVSSAPFSFNQNITTNTGNSMRVHLFSEDLENDSLKFSITKSPDHGKIYDFNNSNGELIYVPEGGFFGEDSIMFRTSDGLEDSNIAKISIHVNALQKITSSPITSISEKEYYLYNLLTNNPDNDSLTYSLISGPSWLSINQEGIVSGKAPEVVQSGSRNIVIQVIDPYGGVANQNYNLNIRNIVKTSKNKNNDGQIFITDEFYEDKYLSQSQEKMPSLLEGDVDAIVLEDVYKNSVSKNNLSNKVFLPLAITVLNIGIIGMILFSIFPLIYKK